MARLVTTGFEFNDFANAAATHPDPVVKGGTAGAASNDSAQARTGTRSLKLAYANAGTCTGTLAFTAATTVSYFFRVALFLDIAPASLAAAFMIARPQPALNPQVWLNTDGSLTSNEGAGTTWAAAGSVTANTWFVLEILCKIDTGNSANAVAQVSFNGGSPNSVVTTGITLPTSFDFGVVNRSGAGTAPGTFNIWADDIALNDSTGAAQNSWSGLGKVVLLKPISLNANGGSWTDSAAATTSAALTAAVNNTPPAGIADTTSSAAHQDRNAAANTSLDMNLATYATAGIGASDTINVLHPLCNTAAPVSTGAKTGSLGITTNPTITNLAFVNGASASADFWSGTTAGTYPTGWKWEKGTITYAPSVTVGSSPVARVTITGGTTTRIAMVCFVGMYVDYTPAVVATVMPPRPTVVLQAVNRASSW